MALIRILLLPFTLLYALGILLRNLCYKTGVLTRFSFDIPVVCVGNLSAGGTGKTPHIAWLTEMLHNQIPIGILSRGYKRRSSGYQFATAESTPEILGDEPYQLYSRFPDVAVAVCENRVLGIPGLLGDAPETGLVLMDDGYQHLPLQAGFYILLTDYSNPFFNDFLLPSGLLREFRSGYKRADVIVVTKCPADMTAQQQAEYIKRIRPLPNQQVLFSSIEYGEPVALDESNGLTLAQAESVVGFSGIANPAPFEQHLRTHYPVAGTKRFSDHHPYQADDLPQLTALFNAFPGNKALVCTEKDAVKLKKNQLSQLTRGIPVYYIPIRVSWFDQGGDRLIGMVKDYIKRLQEAA